MKETKLSIRCTDLFIPLMMLFALDFFDLSGIILSLLLLLLFGFCGKEVKLDRMALLMLLFSAAYGLSIFYFEGVTVDAIIKYAIAPWGCYVLGFNILRLKKDASSIKISKLLFIGFFIHGVLNLIASMAQFGINFNNNYRQAYDFWQPVLSSTNNMGKTLMGYFKGFPSGDVAQLFLRQGTPENAEVCERYYRFSDADAMKSIWNRSVRGTSFDKGMVQAAEKSCIRKKRADEAYKMGAAHKAWMLLARDAVWKCSHWKNEKLLGWLKQIDPDVVFLAPGDGAFAYRVADEIAQYLHRPLVMVCMDDFFIHNRNQGEFLGNIRQRHFMKAVRKTMQNCAAVFTICDEMNKAYSSLFQKSCFTLHTSADNRKLTLDSAASHSDSIKHQR